MRADRASIRAELDDAGCIVEYGLDGRFRMRGRARGYRRGGFGQVLEPAATHGPSDRSALPASPLVIGADERAVAFDIREFERLIWGAQHEEDMQRFLAGNAYFLNAAKFELIAKPQIKRWDGDTVIPDIVIHPYTFDARSVASRIIHLKWLGGGRMSSATNGGGASGPRFLGR